MRHGVVALAAIAVTAAVPSLSDGAQRLAAHMTGSGEADDGFVPPPMPDVEALMTGEPVALSADGAPVIPGGSLPGGEDWAALTPKLAADSGRLTPARAFPRSDRAWIAPGHSSA